VDLDYQETTRLSNAVRTVYEAHRQRIEELKSSSAARWEETDFVWEALLLSFSTWGNAGGMKLFEDSELHTQVRFAALLQLAPSERLKKVETCLRAGNVRWAVRKAVLLIDNFERILRDGGPEAVKRELVARSGSDEKIKFLQTFRGIGKKYARNMMMDVYHEDFRQSIAIDQRIKKILTVFHRKFDDAKYDESERFLLRAAEEADLNGWELDRLLFLYTDEIVASVRRQDTSI
jgi:hypothetical protein